MVPQFRIRLFGELLLTINSLGAKLRLQATKPISDCSPVEQPVVQSQNLRAVGMSVHSSVDWESLQELLASAFVVQESRPDAQLRSVIVQLLRLIRAGELDQNRAMQLIADRTRNVTNATGVAIGQLKGDQLVYQAGSGSAATYIGRHVMVALSVSAKIQAMREILRVEDADTDKRIGAAICRQIGAKSLLILPIYKDRTLAGVLEISFSMPHTFNGREVCTYQLMAIVVGEAMSHAAQVEQKKAAAAKLSTVPQGAERITQAPKFYNDRGSPTNHHTVCPTCGTFITDADKLPSLRASLVTAAQMIIYRARLFLSPPTLGKVARAAVVTVLVVGGWIGYSHRPPASSSRSLAKQISGTQMSTTPMAASEDGSKHQTGPVKTEVASGAARSKLQRVKLEADEQDYVAEDVTTRIPKINPRSVQVRKTQVDYLSDDVTVRYFTPKPALRRVREEDTQVDYISEDVTVRHFTTKPAIVTLR